MKDLYATRFDKVPCITFIGELDINPAFTFLRQKFESECTAVLQHSYFDHEAGKVFFNNTFFVFPDNRMIELAGNYCQLLHTGHHYEWASDLVKELARFRKAVLVEGNPPTVIGFARQTTLN